MKCMEVGSVLDPPAPGQVVRATRSKMNRRSGSDKLYDLHCDLMSLGGQSALS